MMRRASVIVTLFLLISTATAHAECAWVLWVMSPTFAYERVAADPNHDQCIKYAQGFALVEADSLRSPMRNINKINGAEVWSKDGRFIKAFQCWPDNVDPRGPKGK